MAKVKKIRKVYRLTALVPGPERGQIGAVCLHWSLLELMIERVIWHLKGLSPEEGHKLTAKQDITPRLKLMKKLAGEKLSPEEAQTLRDIAGKIKEVKENRHRVVHGLFGMDASGSIFALSYRKDPEGEAVPMGNEEMRKIKRQIWGVYKELEKFVPLDIRVEPV